MKRTIAFDLEGTVVNVEPAHHEGHILAARDFGLVLTLDECFAKLPHFIGGPDDAVAKDIALIVEQEGRTIDYREILEADKVHYHRLLETSPVVPRLVL